MNDGDGQNTDAPKPLPTAAATIVLIYVPGLAEPAGSADTFANRIAHAMDQEAPNASASYSVQPPASTAVASTSSSAVRRIVENANGTQRAALDIYRLDYEDDLRRTFDAASTVKRSILLLWLVIRTGTFQLLPAIWKKGKTPMAKAQLGFALFVAFLLSFYTIILIGAALDTARRVLFGGHHLGAPQGIAVVLAGLSALVPAKSRKALEYMAVDFYAASNYLASGTARSNLTSKLSSLLEQVVESTPGDTPIFVAGLSFGSIVALDAIFPPGAAQPRRVQRISALITVGCPFDLVRSIWPMYFAARAGKEPSLWINVFDPVDVLGSNFLDSGDTQATRSSMVLQNSETPQPGVGLDGGIVASPENLVWESGSPGDRLTLGRILTLDGIRAHGLYWDWTDVNDVGAVRLVVSRLATSFPTLLAQT